MRMNRDNLKSQVIIKIYRSYLLEITQKLRSKTFPKHNNTQKNLLGVIFLVLKNDVSKRQFVFYVLDFREE